MQVYTIDLLLSFVSMTFSTAIPSLEWFTRVNL